MRVLSLIHGLNARSGLFGEAVEAAGHELVERTYTLGNPPAEPPDAYHGVMVFGASMNVPETDKHPWIEDEIRFLERSLEREVPVFGVCFGGQILAAAAGARVTRAREPEIGWYEVERTPDAADDPLFGTVPDRFTAFQWHSYQFDHPPGAVLLAQSPVCPQAYRLGETAWGIQFHAEVTKEIAAGWISSYASDPDAVRIGLDPTREQLRLEERIGRWNGFGRKLVDAFLAAASRRAGVAAEPASA